MAGVTMTPGFGEVARRGTATAVPSLVPAGSAVAVATAPRRSAPTVAWDVRLRRIVAALLVIGLVAAESPLTSAAWRQSFTTTFLALVLEAVPYVLLGSLIGGLIEQWLPADLVPRWSRRLGPFAIPAAVALSPLLPVCECGAVSVARSLLRKGLTPAQAVAYILAAPLTNPTVWLTTWIALRDPVIVAARIAGGVAIATGVGLVVARWRTSPLIAEAIGCGDGCGHDHGHEDGHDHGHDGHDHGAQPARGVRARLRLLAEHVADDFLGIVVFLLLGVVIAAAIKASGWAEPLVDGTARPTLATLAMMGCAFVMSLCAEADAFVAASFGPLPRAALVAFLVFGPMVDLKLVLMYRSLLRTRAVVAIVVLAALGVFAYASLVGWWRP